jgi:hypothetical protein
MWRLTSLNQYDPQIYGCILENDKPRNGEIVDYVFANIDDPKPREETLKVVVTVRLQALEKEGMLTKDIVTPKNVRYFFKDEKAREKARSITYSHHRHLRQSIDEFLAASGGQAGALIMYDFEIMFGAVHTILEGYLNKTFEAIDERRFNDLRRYKENTFRIMSALCDAIIESLEDKKIQEQIQGKGQAPLVLRFEKRLHGKVILAPYTQDLSKITDFFESLSNELRARL